MSASDMCDALKSAFTSMSFSGTTGENQTWAADGTISKEPKVYQVQDGALRPGCSGGVIFLPVKPEQR